MAFADAASHPLHPRFLAYLEAWNRHDVDAILAFHTDDSVFENHTSPARAEGAAAVRRHVTAVFRQFPDIRFELRRLYVTDDLVVQEWTAIATHTVPMLRAGGHVAPTGKALRWDGVDVMPLRDGRIARKDVYADAVGMLRSLGIGAP